jgi:bacterioferritin-associated ferredoxin
MRTNRIKLDSIMIVCVCHRVSDRDIAQAARRGCPNFEALQDDLRVAVGCGACLDCARDTFAAYAAHAGTQAPAPACTHGMTAEA